MPYLTIFIYLFIFFIKLIISLIFSLMFTFMGCLMYNIFLKIDLSVGLVYIFSHSYNYFYFPLNARMYIGSTAAPPMGAQTTKVIESVGYRLGRCIDAWRFRLAQSDAILPTLPCILPLPYYQASHFCYLPTIIANANTARTSLPQVQCQGQSWYDSLIAVRVVLTLPS